MGLNKKVMITNLPGTKIEADFSQAESILNAMFMVDGLVLSQISVTIGVELHTVQNWVKRKYISPPKNKKYSKRQFCRIAIINILKEVFSLTEIVDLLSYINGHLDDESDDLIDDSELYFCMVRVLSELDNDFHDVDKHIMKVIDNCKMEDKKGKGRLERGLKILVIAYASSSLKQRAQLCLKELE